MRAFLLLGALLLAGVTGAALTLAGVDSPATGPLTLLFILIAPAVCVGLLLSGLDPPARAIVAGASSVMLAASVGEVMLVASAWSPDGGVAATAVACAALVAAVLVRRRRSRPAKRSVVPPGRDELAMEP